MTQPASSQERGAFFWFDVARWAAASLVVLEHLRDLIWLPASEAHPSGLYRLVYFATGFGSEAVTAFFVLSGFWITRAVLRRIDAPGFWRGYLIDRLSRLMVVVIPALAIGGTLDAFARFGLDSPLHRGVTGAITLSYDVAARLTLRTLAGNLVFLQTIVVPTFGSNGPLWSLANEFWYYIWFPALFLLVFRRRPGLALAALFVPLLAPKAAVSQLIAGFVIWLAGSLLAREEARARARRWPVWTLAAGGLALVVAMSASRLEWITGSASIIVVGGAFALFAWTLLRVDPPPLRAASPLARYGAGASFSLYAAHFPLLALLAALMLRGNRLAPSAAALALLFALFALATLYGWLFSRITEARTPRIRRWLVQRVAADQS